MKLTLKEIEAMGPEAVAQALERSEAENERLDRLSVEFHARAEKAEAQAAAMRVELGRGVGRVWVPACVAEDRGHKPEDCDGGCEDVEMALCACGDSAPCTSADCSIGRALASDAGRALLDERDALRAEVADLRRRTREADAAERRAEVAEMRIAEIRALVNTALPHPVEGVRFRPEVHGTDSLRAAAAELARAALR